MVSDYQTLLEVVIRWQFSDILRLQNIETLLCDKHVHMRLVIQFAAGAVDDTNYRQRTRTLHQPETARCSRCAVLRRRHAT